MADKVLLQHLLHHPNSPLLAGHSLHVLHQPHDCIHADKGRVRQRRGLAYKGYSCVGIPHGFKYFLHCTGASQQFEILVFLTKLNIFQKLVKQGYKAYFVKGTNRVKA